MVALTVFILLNCIFWAGMDVFVYAVPGHWTIWRIYLPVFVLFSIVLWAWRTLSPRGLLLSAALSGAVTLALIGYAIFLLLTQPLWGVVTLLFVPLLVLLGRTSYRHGAAARRDP